MFQVLYKCNFRPHWYDDVEPTYNYQDAVNMCEQIALNRRCLAVVMNGPYQQVYGEVYGVPQHRADYRT